MSKKDGWLTVYQVVVVPMSERKIFTKRQCKKLTRGNFYLMDDGRIIHRNAICLSKKEALNAAEKLIAQHRKTIEVEVAWLNSIKFEDEL